MTNDPILVDKLELEMRFQHVKDYGGRLILDGVEKFSGNIRSGIYADTSKHKNVGFGKRIAEALCNEGLEFPDNVASGTIKIDGDLFQRIKLDKYLIAYCNQSGVKLVNWDIAASPHIPDVSVISFANFNPKELLGVIAVAIKENASNLGIRYASFDIPALEKNPEINGFMKKYLTRSV